MRKNISVLVVFISILVLPVIASAALPTTATAILTRAKEAVWTIFAVVAVFCFVYAGMLYLTASGDPQKLEKAKKAVIWGVVGIIIAIVAFSAVSIIKALLGVT